MHSIDTLIEIIMLINTHKLEACALSQLCMHLTSIYLQVCMRIWTIASQPHVDAKVKTRQGQHLNTPKNKHQATNKEGRTDLNRVKN